MKIEPNSFAWRALEFYGTRIHHKGQSRIHRWLRHALEANYQCDLEVTRSGLRWILDPSDYVEAGFYWTNDLETWDWFHVNRAVKPNSVVFDVGANFGYYSLLLAKKPGCKIYAFEPESRMFARLQRNIALNNLQNSVTSIRAALSDARGQSRLSTESGNSGASFIDTTGQLIELDTMDDFCKRNLIEKIDFVKIDVEGHEMRVLAGGTEILCRSKPLMLIEFNPQALRRSNTSAVELEDKLRSMGYTLFSSHRNRLVPFTGVSTHQQLLNVFAIHKSNSEAASNGTESK